MNNPLKPGLYNVWFKNLHTFLPLFFEWNGAEWVDIPSLYLTMGGTMYWAENEQTN